MSTDAPDRPPASSAPPTAPAGGSGARKGLVALLIVVSGLAIAAAAAWVGTADSTTASGGTATHYGIMAVVPAIVAIALAFVTRQVILALLFGIITGGIVYGFGAGVSVTDITAFPWRRLNFLDAFILSRLATPGFAIILFVYLWSLGGLIGLWSRTGAALRFAEYVGHRFVVGPRTAKLFTWFIGLVFHQGGTISTVLAGTTARPLLDEHRISKEEQAYLVDSTASPVATILPFNAFPIVAATAMAGTIPLFTRADGTADLGRATSFYYQALGFNFYSIFAVILTFLFALNLVPLVAGMRSARNRVRNTGQLVRPGSEPLMSKELESMEVYPGYRPSLLDFLLPLVFLLVIAVVPYSIQKALGNQPTVYVAEAFFSAVLVAAVLAVVKGMPLKEVLDAIVDGAKGVTVGAIIIGLAVAMGGVALALGTGTYVATLISGLHPGFLPTILLFAAMFTAFSTGTSFGTFGVLLPVAMPLAFALMPGNETYLALCMAAVVGGSTFGDQCSPISDTTILSSLATGCDLMDHVTTQIPYASLAAGAAALLYLLLGFTLF